VTGEIDALTFDAMVDDLDGVRRALGLGRVAVLGHSAHAFLALAYAARLSRGDLPCPGDLRRAGMTAGCLRGPRCTGIWSLAERRRILAQNQARLTPEMLARLTPSERVIVPYVANAPLFFADPTYDCTPLWEGHEQISDRLLARFWGPQGQLAAFDPEASLPKVIAPRSSSARASSISSRRRMPGQVSSRSCRTRRTGRSNAAVTTRSWTNGRRLARRWRAGWTR